MDQVGTGPRLLKTGKSERERERETEKRRGGAGALLYLERQQVLDTHEKRRRYLFACNRMCL